MSVLLILAIGSMLDNIINNIKALMEDIRAFMFGRTHNYRNGWKP